MFNSSFDQKEQIRDAVDIVDLVERYVPLRRQGAIFVGRCPWHDDSRPSLQVNPRRQTFKCWVCDIGGDVFSFVMKVENVEFKEAFRILADMAGIEIKKWEKPRAKPAPRAYNPTSGGDPDAAPIPDWAFNDEIPKNSLYRAMGWLAQKYRDAYLHSAEGEAARQYVNERGISAESAERFQIGYAPLDFGATIDWVGGDRKRVRILEAAGVLAFRDEYDASGAVKPRPRFAPTPKLSDAERRRYYDRFRGRVIFPIRDVQDRVVAFGGRLLPNTPLKSPAKYLNSPETPIFTKSKMVYGLDLARNAIRKTNKVLVVEGYTDCVMAAQFGFENVVAVLGTALGAEHVKMLKRFAEKTILLLDGDEAGRKRAREVLHFFVEQAVDMSVLTLPDSADPCEFLLDKGAEAFADALENSTVDAMEHAFRAATHGIDLDNDVAGATRALDSLLEIVALFPETGADAAARIRMAKTIQRFSTMFRISETEIERQIATRRQKTR
ncbi:MAG: toprim domain-containing protein, partial [Thermoguttaceae bacterium]|nr:toprim domain-containing protein [Thermoguttaceae bacterium]